MYGEWCMKVNLVYTQNNWNDAQRYTNFDPRPWCNILLKIYLHNSIIQFQKEIIVGADGITQPKYLVGEKNDALSLIRCVVWLWICPSSTFNIVQKCCISQILTLSLCLTVWLWITWKRVSWIYILTQMTNDDARAGITCSGISFLFCHKCIYSI